jgi:hypothetical protein
MLKGKLERYYDLQLDEGYCLVETIPAFQADTFREIGSWIVSVITWPDKSLTCVSLGRDNAPIEDHAVVTDWHPDRKVSLILASTISECLEVIFEW